MKAIKRNMKDQILTNDRKILYCVHCDYEASGNAGDYWGSLDNYVFYCPVCGTELELVTKTVKVTYK